jgi:L-rhamnose-H+ transport protein
MLGGLCVSRIGLSLSYALVIGIGASAGSLVPLLYFSPQTLHTAAGRCILLGIAVMLGGLTLVTWAGQQKELQSGAGPKAPDSAKSQNRGQHHSYIAWVLIAALAGILSAGLNFSLRLVVMLLLLRKGKGLGNDHTYAVWALAMLGGMVRSRLSLSALLSECVMESFSRRPRQGSHP